MKLTPEFAWVDPPRGGRSGDAFVAATLRSGEERGGAAPRPRAICSAISDQPRRTLGLVALITALGLGACGSKQTDPAQACKTAAKHGVDAMINQARGRLASAPLPDDVRARMQARQQKLESAGTRMAAVFANRCIDDKWSPDAIACYNKVKTLEEMRECRKVLTPDQSAKLQADELELLAGTAGPPGFDVSDPGTALGAAPRDPRLEMLKQAVNDARKGVAEATTDADRVAAQAQLDALLAEETKLAAEVAALAGGSAAGAGSADADLATQRAALEAEIRSAQAEMEQLKADIIKLEAEIKDADSAEERAELDRMIAPVRARVQQAEADLARAKADAADAMKP